MNDDRADTLSSVDNFWIHHYTPECIHVDTGQTEDHSTNNWCHRQIDDLHGEQWTGSNFAEKNQGGRKAGGEAG